MPPYGGDTQWTNLAVAYDALSAPMRTFIDGLHVVHSIGGLTGGSASADRKESIENRRLISEHPLGRVHPETGERVLYVSPAFTKSIVKLSPRESPGLLELLWEHAVRFRWERGSVAGQTKPLATMTGTLIAVADE